MKNKIVIITEAVCNPPIGPSARRVRCLAKALQSAGWEVLVICMIFRSRPQKQSAVNDDGILYHYPAFYFPYILKTNPFVNIFRGFNLLVVLSRIFFELFRLKNGLVMTYLKHWPIIWMLGVLLKKTNIPYVHEIAEWPPEIPDLSLNLRNFYANNLFRLIDGAIVISDFIENKVVSWNIKNPTKCIRSVKIPILFETYAPANLDPEKESKKNPSFLWCGDLEAYFTLIKFVLDALSIACKNNNKVYSLSLCGRCSEVVRDKLIAHANTLDIDRDQVTFLGFISDDALIGEMFKASALLAPMHDDNRSRARFPTKIAEYLITGKPIIATGIGEVAKYLTDGENAYIARPDDPDHFAEKMRLAVSDPIKSRQVGANGRETAFKYFYFETYGKVLDHFCLDLINSKSGGRFSE